MRKNNPTVVFAVALLILSSVPSVVYAGQTNSLTSSLRTEYLMTVFVFMAFMGVFFLVVQKQHANDPKKTGKRTGRSTFGFGEHDGAKTGQYKAGVKPKVR